ncbi:LCP family protein [Sporosarcina siberiensis]|uniref:Regulatory protein MsrR n=1 Tax=Sporosarcina siberiensis TaxID=1365606 RepID=A0ABW4SIF8_9BACL
MEEQYDNPIPKRRRKKKLRIGRTLFALLTLAFIVAGTYSVVQYNAGKTIAKGNSINPGPFKGDAIHPKYPSVENYLLLGVDDDGSEKSRTDTMMVLSWDKGAGKMKVISFMRDIYAEIPGYKSYKLNTAYYLNGVQTAKDTITGMFGIPIHHYAIVDFNNFESIVNIAFPDGVEIDVKKEMSEKIGVTLLPGKKRLNGKELLGYARFRADSEGDFGRVGRQQEIISAMKDEAIRPGMILAAPKLAGAISSFVHTNLTSKDEISRAVSLLMKKGAKLETMTIPVEGSYSFNTYKHAGSVLELNIEENKQAINTFLEAQTE